MGQGFVAASHFTRSILGAPDSPFSPGGDGETLSKVRSDESRMGPSWRSQAVTRPCGFTHRWEEATIHVCLPSGVRVARAQDTKGPAALFCYLKYRSSTCDSTSVRFCSIFRRLLLNSSMVFMYCTRRSDHWSPMAALSCGAAWAC